MRQPESTISSDDEDELVAEEDVDDLLAAAVAAVEAEEGGDKPRGEKKIRFGRKKAPDSERPGALKASAAAVRPCLRRRCCMSQSQGCNCCDDYVLPIVPAGFKVCLFSCGGTF